MGEFASDMSVHLPDDAGVPTLIVRLIRTKSGVTYELGEGITAERALQVLAESLAPRLPDEAAL